MAESDESLEPREFDGTLTEEDIRRVDLKLDSPEVRAQKVWDILLGKTSQGIITNWDVVCFSTETLGFFSTEFPWLKPVAILVAKTVYKAHYINWAKIMEHDTPVTMRTSKMNIPRMSG